MIGKIRYEMIVGLVVLSALTVLGYYTIIMSKKEFEPKGSYDMTVIFTDVGGLEVSNKVNIKGVFSGTVREIQLQDEGVRVTMRMYNSFKLYENYRIAIRSEAALGGKNVSIYPGGGFDSRGYPFPIVQTRDALSGELDDPFLSISKLIDENRANVRVAVRNIREISEKVNRGTGTVGKLLNEDKVHAQTGKLLKEASDVLEDAREQAPITSFIRAALTAF